MIGGGGGGAGTAAERAATWTAVVRLISSFRSFQEATLPVAKPSAHALNLPPIEAILLVGEFQLLQQVLELRKAPLRLQGSAGNQRHNQRFTGGPKKARKSLEQLASAHRY